MEIKQIFATGYMWLQLIIDEKTALIDCAMSQNKDEVLSGLKQHLGDRQLDYVLLTHSHFDHVGTLSDIRKAYPNVKVVASAKTAKVFASEGARSFMSYMTNMLCEFGHTHAEFDPSGLYVDIVAGEGTEIDLGECRLSVMESKGHTDCSISFFCKEKSILFASESIGVWYGKYPPNLEICKGYRDVLQTIQRQRSLGAKVLYLSHSGLLSGISANEYFTMVEHCMIYYKDIVYTAIAEGKSDEEICSLCRKKIFDVSIENGIDLGSVDRWTVNTMAFIAYARKNG